MENIMNEYIVTVYFTDHPHFRFFDYFIIKADNIVEAWKMAGEWGMKQPCKCELQVEKR